MKPRVQPAKSKLCSVILVFHAPTQEVCKRCQMLFVLKSNVTFNAQLGYILSQSKVDLKAANYTTANKI